MKALVTLVFLSLSISSWSAERNDINCDCPSKKCPNYDASKCGFKHERKPENSSGRTSLKGKGKSTKAVAK